MAMIIKNNAMAANSLHILSKNESALAKDLKKASSGMKINGAGDGASEYSIAHKLAVMESSLAQDIDNVKTGGKLVAVAEGGIQEIVNNLREMKAMALNSANGHNTDLDRATLQKEFSSRMDTVTDIAATTNYNGRLLLNGDYYAPVDRMESKVTEIVTTKAIHVGPPSITTTPSVVNGKTVYTIRQDNALRDLAANFTPVGRTRVGNIIACDTAHTVCTGYMMTNDSVTDSVYSNNISVKLDFSGAKAAGGAITYPDSFDQQGFTILCSGCNQFINIRFDASITGSKYISSMPSAQNSYSSDHEYVIGIQNVTNASELEDAVFSGIANAAGKPTDPMKPDTATSVTIDTWHNVCIAKNAVGTGYVLLKDSYPSLGIYDKGTYLGTTTDLATSGITEGTTAINAGETKTITNTSYVTTEELVHDPGNPLIIHTGTKSSQNMRVYINSMHPIAMGLNQAAVTPWEKALAALGLLDHALDYALDENTRMGAYQTKLLETQENLVTENTNTTAAKSTIQDADIAKTITELTKHNVLTQAAQLMLAQANQSASSVLSLLK